MRACAALVLALLLSPLDSARAEEVADVAALLVDGDKRYGELDYRGAAEVAERAAQDPRATPAQRGHGWERVGLSWLVLGQRTLAREAFDRLFAIDPARGIEDPSLSPRQREFIEEVRRQHPAPKTPPVEPKPDDKPKGVGPTAGRQPTPVPTPTLTKKPVWKRWYLWTPIAIGLAGLGVGLTLGLRTTWPPGTLGTVGLGLHF